jgi:hypothetical protein
MILTQELMGNCLRKLENEQNIVHEIGEDGIGSDILFTTSNPSNQNT